MLSFCLISAWIGFFSFLSSICFVGTLPYHELYTKNEQRFNFLSKIKLTISSFKDEWLSKPMKWGSAVVQCHS